MGERGRSCNPSCSGETKLRPPPGKRKMGNGPNSRKKTGANRTGSMGLRFNKTKNFSKMVDQIYTEKKNAAGVGTGVAKVVGLNKEQEFDPDLPAGGQFYCHETDKYFI